MKRKLFSLLLAVVMMLAALPVTAFAAAEDIRVDNAEYYDTGELKLFNITFDWTSDDIEGCRLVLMKNRLREQYPGCNPSDYGDFSDMGCYRNSFKKFEDVQEQDNVAGTFGIISYSDNISEIKINTDDFSTEFNFAKGVLTLNANETYYLYLWVSYSGQFYPDNLICAIRVQDGQLQYSPAIDSGTWRNHYDDQAFVSVAKTGHTCTPTTVWQKDANNHWHLKCQDTTCGNNQVKIDEATHKYTDNADTTCNTCGYTRTVNTHTCLKSGWLWDKDGHWRRGCQDATCNSFTTKVDAGKHVYTDDYDTTCNTCGYIRTAPAQHPETGDITNIPLWTAIFVGGMALLWFQMEQRKRAQF